MIPTVLFIKTVSRLILTPKTSEICYMYEISDSPKQLEIEQGMEIDEVNMFMITTY